MDQAEFLKNSLAIFHNSNSAIIKIGCELEFFLLGANSQSLNDFIAELSKKKWRVEKERGALQIEVKTDFTADLEALCRDLEEKKKIIKNLAKKQNFIASFTAQPFADDCGSALQFNISLHDKNDKNLFDEDPEILQNSIDSLLSATNQILPILAPQQEDYLRFSRELNRKLFAQGKFSAPINLSFGNNNRTCAIRIAKGESKKRLEYRVASANANPRLCISALIFALATKSVEKFAPTFGNAFDEQFELKPIIQSLDEAKEEFRKSIFAKFIANDQSR